MRDFAAMALVFNLLSSNSETMEEADRQTDRERERAERVEIAQMQMQELYFKTI